MIENYLPPQSPLDIIYKDDDIVVLNKPSGLLSVPGRDPKHHDCIQYRAQKEFKNALIVHRLDMDTSGIIVMALNKKAQRYLSIQFQERKVEKKYIARVYGHLNDEEGLIDLPLICDWPNRPKQKVDYNMGKPSQTRWRTLGKTRNETRVLLMPITGRSHQLRVHLMSINHPILGDRFYAHEKALGMSSRLCLHATSLTIKHPTADKTIVFTSEPNF